MEQEKSRIQAAAETFQRQQRRFWLIRCTLIILPLAALCALNMSIRDIRLWFCGYLLILAVWYVLFRGVRRWRSRQYLSLEAILLRECDSVTYTEIWRLLEKKTRKPVDLYRLNEAKGLLFSGHPREAAALLEDMELRRPDLSLQLAYQNVAFNCAVVLDNLRQAEEIRRETARILKKARAGSQMRKSGEMLLMMMAGRLALEHGDSGLMREMEARYTEPLQRVTSAYHLARADLKEKDPVSARARLRFAAEHGGTLIHRERARKLLEELEREEGGSGKEG